MTLVAQYRILMSQHIPTLRMVDDQLIPQEIVEANQQRQYQQQQQDSRLPRRQSKAMLSPKEPIRDQFTLQFHVSSLRLDFKILPENDRLLFFTPTQLQRIMTQPPPEAKAGAKKEIKKDAAADTKPEDEIEYGLQFWLQDQQKPWASNNCSFVYQPGDALNPVKSNLECPLKWTAVLTLPATIDTAQQLRGTMIDTLLS